MVHGESIHLVGRAGDGMFRCGSGSPLNYGANIHQADLASAMPTAGGLYFWTHYFAGRQWKNPLSFLIRVQQYTGPNWRHVLRGL